MTFPQQIQPAVSDIAFLLMNGIEQLSDEDSLERVGLSAADGKTNKEEIARFFRDNSGPAE
jgi:prophage maintenance system killer protein